MGLRQTAGDFITRPGEHVRSHHEYQDTNGFIVMFTKHPDNRQWSGRLKQLQTIPEFLTGKDSYFSMNTFHRTFRRIEFLRQLKALYVDIDFYNSPLYKDTAITAEQVEGAVLQELDDNELPDPNHVIYSGRGLVLVWHLDPVPSQALPRWQGVQDHITKLLEPYGADTVAKDCTRIFRMAGTINSKSGKQVYVKELHGERLDLSELTDKLFGTREEREAERGKKKGRASARKVRFIKFDNRMTLLSLAQSRLEDLQTLIELRGGEMTGHREMTLFLYRHFTRHFLTGVSALGATLAVNDSFTRPLSRNEVERATASGERYQYKYSNKRLIEVLGITDEEQRHMKTIIGDKEKRRRDRERKETTRRAGGVQTRAEYWKRVENTTAGHLERVRAILEENPTIKNKDLAEMVGLSLSMTKNYKALVKAQKRPC